MFGKQDPYVRAKLYIRGRHGKVREGGKDPAAQSAAAAVLPDAQPPFLSLLSSHAGGNAVLMYA